MPSADWFDEQRHDGVLDLSRVRDDGVDGLVWTLVGAGALVSLGATRDGGALGVTVTFDGRWRREYFRDAVELGVWLNGALAAVDEAGGTRAPSGPGGRSRSRRQGPRSL